MTPTRALIAAAEAMLAKLDQIEPSVNAMIGVQLARTGWQYDGPNYAQEKTALLAAISSAKAAEEEVEAIPVNWAVSLAESTLTPSSNITQIRSVEKVVAALRKRS